MARMFYPNCFNVNLKKSCFGFNTRDVHLDGPKTIKGWANARPQIVDGTLVIILVTHNYSYRAIKLPAYYKLGDLFKTGLNL